MQQLTESILNAVKPANCICFDAEFARGMEMLELSIVDMRGHTMYQQRFKPRRYRTWDSDIHHITPAMVATAPSFAACRRRIQAIIDNCSYIVGFAVRENDISKMKRQYVQGLDSKQVLELRDWFWVCHGRHHGLDYLQGISLKLCCEQLGMEHDDGKAHSAAYDAAVTLECFKLLFDRFISIYGNGRKYLSFADVVTHFRSIFKKYKYEYDLERAAGYCAIVRAGDEFLLKATREKPDACEQTIACIAMYDRKKALMRLSEKFTGTTRCRSFFFRKLNDTRLAYFRKLEKA